VVAGHDYTVLGVPQRQDINGKIEVIESSRGLSALLRFTRCWRAGRRRCRKTNLQARTCGSWASGMGQSGKGVLRPAVHGDVARLDVQIFEAITKNMRRYLTSRASRRGGKARCERGEIHGGVSLIRCEHQCGAGRGDAAVGYRVAGIPTIAVAGKYTVTGDSQNILAVSG